MTYLSSSTTPLSTPRTPLFGTVLVANRGEIACRVIRTLRAPGDPVGGGLFRRRRRRPARARGRRRRPDRPGRRRRELPEDRGHHPGLPRHRRRGRAPRLRLPERKRRLRPRPGRTPGSRSSAPASNPCNVMGDKIRSKNHVAGYGVPVVPGIAEPGMTDAQLIEAAAGVGFPLLIKPSAGGGGKGMHIVERPEDLEATLATARRVAASAFGDDTLFLERLVLTPRHIEVQVLADNHGNVIHLGERECSLQRRHQKVIEEAPSPLLESLPDGAAIRARIGEAACNAARSVNYCGAGTVEFLVSDNAPDEFFFMEMNTRLQVEHPVTEMVTGVDLVEWQVRIAAGEELTVQPGRRRAHRPLGGGPRLRRGAGDRTSCRPSGRSCCWTNCRTPRTARSGWTRPCWRALQISPQLRPDDLQGHRVGRGPGRGPGHPGPGARRVYRPGHRHQRRIPAAADQRRRRPRRTARHRPDRAQDAGVHFPACG